jgi:Uma2 family endonuclease
MRRIEHGRVWDLSPFPLACYNSFGPQASASGKKKAVSGLLCTGTQEDEMTSVIHDSVASPYLGHPPLIVQLRPVLDLTDDQFLELSQLNRDLRMELTAQRELIIMPPTGGEAGDRNAELTMQLRSWAKRDGTGSTFDSSTGFRLPDRAVRSPDGSWVRRSRLDALTPEQMKEFIPLCPDFVVELRSPTDSLNVTQEKMQEYIENGALLGWLIDPEQRRVYVYRPNQRVEEMREPESLAGDPLLPGFVLDLNEIW